MLRVFFRAAKVPEDALGCLHQLGNPSTYRLGWSTLVRVESPRKSEKWLWHLSGFAAHRQENLWSIQLVVLSTLGSVAPQELMDHMSIAWLGVISHRIKKEVVAVRAAAISHLGHLRSRGTVPPTAEEAITELVTVLIRLGDHPVVALVSAHQCD
ncbi:hypothetical protein lerEdw1_011289 [Lerista edwardsae]|nr:hypothetical protein lerEdw1_011289 [Lerista edwardsae]